MVDRLTERKIRRAKASGASYQAVADQFGLGLGVVLAVFRQDRKDEYRRGPCEICGKDERFRVRHHTDYIKGIVLMICPHCHSHPATDMIRVRLKAHEFAKLDSLLSSDVSGICTRSELIRLLIHREWNRRRNLDKPSPQDWQSAFRNGRPAKDKLACTGQQKAASLPHG